MKGGEKMYIEIIAKKRDKKCGENQRLQRKPPGSSPGGDTFNYFSSVK